MIERYATPSAWAEWFEKNEGVGISASTIHRRVQEALAQPKVGKDAHNRAFSIFSESDVRNACANLFGHVPKNGKSGFFVKDGIRYGTVGAWGRELQISTSHISNRLRSFSAQPIKNRNIHGNIRDFYSMDDIQKACGEILAPLPEANEYGLVMIDGVRHGSIGSLARFLKISHPTIDRRVASSGLAPIRGRAKGGQLRDLYPEPKIRELCADLLSADLACCDDGGFVEIGGIRHGTIRPFSRLLGVSQPTIVRRLVSLGVVPIHGKDTGGRLV